MKFNVCCVRCLTTFHCVLLDFHTPVINERRHLPKIIKLSLGAIINLQILNRWAGVRTGDCLFASVNNISTTVVPHHANAKEIFIAFIDTEIKCTMRKVFGCTLFISIHNQCAALSPVSFHPSKSFVFVLIVARYIRPKVENHNATDEFEKQSNIISAGIETKL